MSIIMTLRFDLPCDITGPRLARRVTADALQANGFRGDIEVVQLLVAEVATNAIVHGRPPLGVTVRLTGESLWVGVADTATDTSPSMFRRGRRGPEDSNTGHWGMQIVDRLADEWGCIREPDNKTVWFTLSGSSSNTH